MYYSGICNLVHEFVSFLKHDACFICAKIHMLSSHLFTHNKGKIIKQPNVQIYRYYSTQLKCYKTRLNKNRKNCNT